MIASQAESIVLTWLINPKPSRNVQLMTEVKCGTQPSPNAITPPSRPNIRGTLRHDTTAYTTSKTHNARTSAGWSDTILFAAGSAAFPPANCLSSSICRSSSAILPRSRFSALLRPRSSSARDTAFFSTLRGFV